MPLGEYKSELIGLVEETPGGISMVENLFSHLDIRPGQKILDVGPSPGIIPLLLALEYKAYVTALISGPAQYDLIRIAASEYGVDDLVTVIKGGPSSIPLPSEFFHRAYSVANPFPIPVTPGVISEMHRMIAQDGLLGIAGPASMINSTPVYMNQALKEYDGVTFRTPAWTALAYAKDGFHVVKAEYQPGAYDLWLGWASKADSDSDKVSKEFLKAIKQDAGRWLSLGVIVLRKPPKPVWAV